MSTEKNLDFLRSAVYINREKEIDKNSVSDNGSTTFNKMFVDPYKKYTMDFAGSLKIKRESISDDRLKSLNTNTKFCAIKSYVYTNLKDILLSLGASFVDDLQSQFIYDKSTIEQHYEFEFPFSIITKHDRDIVEDALLDVYFERNIKDIIKNFKENDDLSTYILVYLNSIMNSLYSYFVSHYFNQIVINTTTFYLNHPEICSDFYKSFFEMDLVPFKNNGYNNLYNYISIALRDMMDEKLKEFNNCLSVISGTVQAMILGSYCNDYKLSFDEYVTVNPFIYEILVQENDADSDEEGEEEDE